MSNKFGTGISGTAFSTCTSIFSHNYTVINDSLVVWGADIRVVWIMKSVNVGRKHKGTFKSTFEFQFRVVFTCKRKYFCYFILKEI